MSFDHSAALKLQPDAYRDRQPGSGQQSDHLLMVAAYDGWQAARKQVSIGAVTYNSGICYRPRESLCTLTRLMTQLRWLQGHNAQRSFAQKHFLSTQTLEMISEIRNQFGSMLADTQLLARPAKGFERTNSWIDDQSQAWNTYAKHVALV